MNNRRLQDLFECVGTSIDAKFEVREVAGEGGFGVVYRAWHLGLDIPVALKGLRLPDVRDERLRKQILTQFREEARILHRLSKQTAHIVQVLDVGGTTTPSGLWMPYMVMEWLDGFTLDQVIRQEQQPRGLIAAMDFLAPAAQALALAHDEGISHRDIKPSNLFLASPRAGRSLLKILDFGIAKVFGDDAAMQVEQARTGDSTRPFTPTHGAPEQFSSEHGATGPWTDVFAFTLLLIEVATGHPALTGRGMMALYQSAIGLHEQAALFGDADIDEHVVAIIRRALAPNPRDRFRNLGQMWSALQTAGARRATMPKVVVFPAAHTPATVTGPTVLEARDATLLPTATAPPAIGENRVCTVLVVYFCWPNGGQRPPVEAMKDVVDRCLSAFAREIPELGHVRERSDADLALWAFGVPSATEGDAERATIVGARIMQMLRRMPLPRSVRGQRPTARIAIVTGRVFVNLHGPGVDALNIIGEAVDTAKRIVRAAPADAIVLGRDTYRQVASVVQVEPLPSIEQGTLGEPLLVYRLLERAASPTHLASADFRGLETRLIGRAAEKQKLEDVLETVVVDHQPLLVTIVGAPGLGRDRLLLELHASLGRRSEKFFVAQGAGFALAQDTSYGLVARMVRQIFSIRDDDSPARIRSKVRVGLRWLMRTRPRKMGDDRTYREMRLAHFEAAFDVMGIIPRSVPRDAGQHQVIPNVDDDGARVKQRLQASMVNLVRLATSRAPVVLLCNDLHWVDDASLDLLEEVLTHAEGLPLLVVSTTRPELFDRRSSWGAERPSDVRIDLTPLARRHVEEMIRDRLRRVRHLPTELVQRLADRAESNPRILEEMLHLLVDMNVIEVHDDKPWRIHDERRGALELPATVRGIVQARIDRLAPEARSLLIQAAAVGRTFWEGALEQANHLRVRGSRSVSNILAELRERRLVRRREPSALHGENEYTFVDSAMYEVASEMPSEKVRRALHLAVAQWLDGRGYDALLAEHAERAGQMHQAAEAYRRAAGRAAALNENLEAVRHLGNARKIHDESAGGDEEFERGEDDDGQPWERRIASSVERVSLRLEMGDVFRRLGRLDEAEQAYHEARAHILRVERRAEASLEAKQIQELRLDAQVDFRFALLCKVRGTFDEAHALVSRAITRAHAAHAHEDTPPMYGLVVFLLRRKRQFSASWEAARRGLRICRQLRERDHRWKLHVAEMLHGVAASLYGLRRYVAAERTFRQITRIIPDSSEPHIVAVALNGLACVRLALKDMRGAREFFLQSLELKERAGDVHQLAIAHNNLAEVTLGLGDIEAALEHARKSVELGERLQAVSDLAEMHRNLAEALLAGGQIEAALDQGAKSLDIAQKHGQLYIGEVARTVAHICIKVAEIASVGDALHVKARGTATKLLAVLDTFFTADDLQLKAAEIRQSLGPLHSDPVRICQ